MNIIQIQKIKRICRRFNGVIRIISINPTITNFLVMIAAALIFTTLAASAPASQQQCVHTHVPGVHKLEIESAGEKR